MKSKRGLTVFQMARTGQLPRLLTLLLSLLLLQLPILRQANGFQLGPASSPVRSRCHRTCTATTTTTISMRTQPTATASFSTRRSNCQSCGSLRRRRRQQFVLQSSATAASSSSSPPEKENKAGIAGATFNLIKACIGSGVLALPAGLAVASDVPKAVIPASIFLVAIGAVSAYTFHALGRISHETQATTLGDMWKKIVGESSAWIVDLSTAVMTLGVCVTYSMLLGDFTTDLLQQTIGRNACILGLTLTCLYPLARLQSLTALAPVSLVGVAGIAVTCIVMIAQFILSKNGSTLLASAPLPPSFSVMGASSNPLSGLVLASMAATAYLCHFSAPDFLNMVQGSMKKYTRMTVLGFSSVALVNVIILAMGFLTFGGNCAGVILNSYASNDPLASLCRLLMIISVIGSYPFLLAGAKSAIYSLIATTLKKNREKATTDPSLSSSPSVPVIANNDGDTEADSVDTTTTDNDEEKAAAAAAVVSPRTNHLVTIALLLITTLPSLVLRNAGFVVSFNGATMGSAITYIFPAILVLKNANATVGVATVGAGGGNMSKRAKAFNGLVMAWGIVAAIAGGTVSVLSAYAPHTLR